MKNKKILNRNELHQMSGTTMFMDEVYEKYEKDRDKNGLMKNEVYG